MTVTLTTASLLAIWFVFLSLRIGPLRMKAKASLGDGGDRDLLRAVRAHGNLTEFAPIMLIMLGLLEYNQANTTLVFGLGVVFVTARLLHGIGLGFPKLIAKEENIYRLLGTVLSVLSVLVAGITGLLIVYGVI